MDTQTFTGIRDGVDSDHEVAPEDSSSRSWLSGGLGSALLHLPIVGVLAGSGAFAVGLVMENITIGLISMMIGLIGIYSDCLVAERAVMSRFGLDDT
ncbi:MAG: hypothetical protein ABJN26_08780 [Stappiaceae bacterium]